MRTFILSRSVIAVASLAIGSATLAATPATATTASGITRDMVLTVAMEVRAAEAAETSISFATERKIQRLVARACNVEQDGINNIDYVTARSAGPAGGSVDGLIMGAGFREFTDGGQESYRECNVAALATTDAAFALSGNVALTTSAYDQVADTPLAPVTTSSTLSGDVFVTPAFNLVDNSKFIIAGSFSATGNTTRPFNVTTTEKVATPKSKSAKKSAKKTYTKKLKAAKKSYTKAIDKAGKSKNKKATAKKAYSKKRAAAKAAYNKAVATSKTVTKTTTQAENHPFSLNGGYEYS